MSTEIKRVSDPNDWIFAVMSKMTLIDRRYYDKYIVDVCQFDAMYFVIVSFHCDDEEYDTALDSILNNTRGVLVEKYFKDTEDMTIGFGGPGVASKLFPEMNTFVAVGVVTDNGGKCFAPEASVNEDFDVDEFLEDAIKSIKRSVNEYFESLDESTKKAHKEAHKKHMKRLSNAERRADVCMVNASVNNGIRIKHQMSIRRMAAHVNNQACVKFDFMDPNIHVLPN